jgi:hypothetical protein
VPVQSVALVAEHWPQEPPGWQAGVAPPHSPSPAHARHVLVPASQTGLPPGHCALEVQPTHTPTPEERSQTGVAPVQRVVLLAEHWPQAPEVWQAGAFAPQSASAAQARQVKVVVSQAGVVPPQLAAERQPAHVPALVRQ